MTAGLKKFTLRILWLDCSIAFSVDHIAHQGYSPLTPYFFWPRNDAWSQVKNELESKPWISENDKIDILNEVTLLLNHWQERKQNKSIIEAQKKFPDFIFYGAQ